MTSNNTPDTHNSIEHTAIIPASYAGLRLDRALSQLFNQYSRARLQTWLKDQLITVDGKPARANVKVNGGEQIVLYAPPASDSGWAAQDMALSIWHEDESVIIINKPPGLVVHPGAGNSDGTLVNALLHYHEPLQQIPRAGIIHRLDKDTSGLLVIAKTLTAHHNLVQQLQARDVKRHYAVIVNGVMTGGGTIDAPIGRHPRFRQRMAVLEHGGRAAVTHYRLVQRFPAHTLVQAHLETGRTHQIRVHFSHINYPVLGDPVYSKRSHLPKGASQELVAAIQAFPRQALHAQTLGFVHPDTGVWQEWTTPLPADMQTLLDKLSS